MWRDPARPSSKRSRSASLAAAVAGVALQQLWVWHWSPRLLAFSFGGDRARVAAISSGRGLTSGFTGATLISVALQVVASVLIGWALLVWWPHGWRSGAHRSARPGVAFLPLASAGFCVLEAVVALVAVDHVAGTFHVGDFWAAVIAGLGQMKWLLAFLSALAFVLTVYGAIRFRRLSFVPAPAADGDIAHHGDPVDAPVHGSAICVSGGGIRAAAFAWGALAGLERSRPLTAFDRLYSVSGGGYTAAALTSAPDLRRAERFFSDAQLAPSTVPSDSDRYEFVLSRRRYLANGNGGLVRALVLALLSVGLNLVVVFFGVAVMAVPVGLVAKSELGSDGLGAPGGVGWPIVAITALGVVAILASALLRQRSARLTLALGVGLLAGSAGIGVVRVGLPWLAEHAESLLSAKWWTSILPAIVLWLVSFLFAIVKPRLTKAAIRLGGLVAALAMVAAAIFVTRTTIRSGTIVVDAPWLLIIGVVFLVVIDMTGVQWWSLHPIYRDRLATTFVFEDSDEGLRPQHYDAWLKWSDVHGRRSSDTAQPMHVVCAATHRRRSDVTGLRSMSFTFSADGVDMYEPARDPLTGSVTVTHYHRDAAWLDVAVRANRRLAYKSNKRSSVIAAAAMSGAAVNPAMGRLSKGSTDSLLAVLNLRLGVWLPNPRFDSSKAAEPSAFTKPGLRYLFHEVIRHYDTTDPFIHVSDGGHWENLGLVEALRQRHRHIVCIDASGDHFSAVAAPGAARGLGTLYEAVDLARMELHVEVRIDADQFEMMLPDHRTGRSVRNWMECPIIYHRDPDHHWLSECDRRCRTGTLLFVKASICDRTPESVISFANTDRVFPNYSTGDQFLTDGQFRSLVGLGESAMRDAVGSLGETWFTKHPIDAGTLNQRQAVR